MPSSQAPFEPSSSSCSGQDFIVAIHKVCSAFGNVVAAEAVDAAVTIRSGGCCDDDAAVSSRADMCFLTLPKALVLGLIGLRGDEGADGGRGGSSRSCTGDSDSML